jgi:hypothetical protein
MDKKEKISKVMSKKRKDDNKIGHWSERENIKYYSFIKKYIKKFTKKQYRREYKVFKTMS